MHRILSFAIVLFLLSGCLDDNDLISPKKKAKWTILVYMDSDNNLEPNSIGDIDKLESAGSDDNVRILVQWDRIEGYDSSNGDWTGTKRFLILGGSQDGIVESQELVDLGEVDMGNMDSLTEFIKWAVENYPAEKYLLDIWDHGGGWGPHTQDETNGSQAEVQELAEALENAGFGPNKKIDLLVLNQCLMGQADVAYAMAPYAKVMVASEEIVPGPGIEYTVTLKKLKQNPGMDERQVAAELVAAYQAFYTENVPQPFTTLAAYNLEAMGEVGEAFTLFTETLSEKAGESWPEIGKSIYYSEAFAKYGGALTTKSVSSYDMLDFAGLLEQNIDDSEVREATEQLKEAVQKMAIVEYHGKEHPFAKGISIYFPEDELLYQKDYEKASSFGSESGWNSFLKKYIALEKTDMIAPSIEISSVSSQTASLTKPITIYGTATGNNIVSLTRTVGKIQGNSVLLINTHELTQNYREYEGERKLPEFFDGENNINYTWTPMAEIITNGRELVIAPLQPAGQSDYYFSAIGEYRSASEQKTFDASLVFDYRIGSLIGAMRLNEAGGKITPSSFQPREGDTFTPYIEAVNLSTGEIGLMKADPIQLREQGIWLDLTLLGEGQYSIGLIVTDISGNMAPGFTTVTVEGQPESDETITLQDIMGKWVGEKLGFEIFDDGSCTSSVGLRQNKCSYWFRNAAMPLISFYISTDESTEPVFAVFTIERSQNMLYLTEMLEGTRYALWREGTTPVEQPASIDDSLIGKWFNELGSIEFREDASYSWETGGTTIIGSFSTENGTLYLATEGKKTPYTYIATGNALQLTDPEGSMLSFTKYTGTEQPQANPIAGSWYNATVNETVFFNADGTYQSYMSGSLFVEGTYSTSGNVLALSNAYTTFYYAFTITGDVLTLYDPVYYTTVSYTRIR
ncbi:MAG: hypothetical protein JW744_00775 [Candidatus Diapherotrites archaeon]|uniref:Clostripain n=1 Tax=Candidatus Iainarchaeum sp. TaxID=3101447 RepID=A0A938YMM3_9ARCH|nr:hypothetical protein [Candidatus Diapherotrites archaeon]